jgi:glucitol operon activator protein
MTNLVISLLGAIAAGICIQAFLTYRQTQAFSSAVRGLKQFGTVCIGAGGAKYRGGKAFVAIATDDHGRVTKAITLTGWTTFARPNELHHVQGVRLSQLRREEPLPGVKPKERAALRNAAETLHGHLVKAA